MEISFSLADLFVEAFGYRSKAFDPDFKLVSGDSPSSRLSSGMLGSPYYAADAAGREVFLPVTFTYSVSADAGSTVERRDWMLPYCVVSVSGRKTIVETPLTERRGTVKELINIQDYVIRIKGFLAGSGNNFPEQETARLRDLFEANLPVSLKCALTDLFLLHPDRSGSDNVVLRELSFPALTGVKHIRPFELVCVSDEPFSLVAQDS